MAQARIGKYAFFGGILTRYYTVGSIITGDTASSSFLKSFIVLTTLTFQHCPSLRANTVHSSNLSLFYTFVRTVKVHNID
jgi:hypothetical protein